MHFRFQELCPHVFQDQEIESEVWNKNFEITSSEKVLIHAVSGKGKTSFIYYLLGLRDDYSGEIYLDNKLLSSLSVADWTRIRSTEISCVFQDLQLFEKLSVKENFSILPSLAPSYEMEDAKNMLDILDIAHKWESTVGDLSFGQKQRVALIRSLMKPFDLLVCDEPFSHLDSQNTEKCIGLIEKRLEEEQAGFILSALDSKQYFSGLKTIQL
jgi:ABC-type lipoprotein export system ATPase subunit